MISRIAVVAGGAALVLGVAVGEARAQYGQYGPYPQTGMNGPYGGGYGQGYGGGAYPPSPYFAQNQTLSPYLNLELGRNPAVNYFNAVRPAQQANAFYGGLGGGYGGMMGRQVFFPNAVDTLDQLDDSATANPSLMNRMAPTGHPAGFNNTLGYVGPAGPGQRRPPAQGAAGTQPRR
jgi:hypothetical protein